MSLKAKIKKYDLKFTFPAGTSRGILKSKPSWFLILDNGNYTSIGECSIIPGLSPDNPDLLEPKLNEIVQEINHCGDYNKDLTDFPAIAFALETAMMDMNAKGTKLLFPSNFTKGMDSIPINGLIWMGDKDYIQNQIKDKLNKGFRILKLKVGALDFNADIEIIKQLRKEFKFRDLKIRLDANGAFSTDEAIEKLNILSKFNIHSIEQPIKPGNWNKMKEICIKSPIDIALDEELIGLKTLEDKLKLINHIKPKYIILKPSLLGGLNNTQEWISMTEQEKIGWWITSALESNIGLNAIAQWTYLQKSRMVQGLGTGKIFKNNIPSPLYMQSDKLYYNPDIDWNIKILDE